MLCTFLCRHLGLLDRIQGPRWEQIEEGLRKWMQQGYRSASEPIQRVSSGLDAGIPLWEQIDSFVAFELLATF